VTDLVRARRDDKGLGVNSGDMILHAVVGVMRCNDRTICDHGKVSFRRIRPTVLALPTSSVGMLKRACRRDVLGSELWDGRCRLRAGRR
jgi:hypothetical protein